MFSFRVLALVLVCTPLVSGATLGQKANQNGPRTNADARAAARPVPPRAVPSRRGAPQRGAPMSLRALVYGTSPLAQSMNPSNFGPVAAAMSGVSISVVRAASPRANAPAPVPVPGIGGTSLLLRVDVAATGATELFSLYVPSTPAGLERPLLVAFHRFGVSHLDIAGSTTFFQEAMQRGWYLVAPLSASTVGNSQISYGSVQSQLNVEAVLDLVIANLDIDLDRIYGVGFSMGGGAAASYAARHRDRARGAFAAVVNHTGTIALADVWSELDPAGQSILESLFGGTPSQSPFAYQRSSIIDIDPMTGGVNPLGQHMAVNLESVPMQTWYGVGDPLGYLVDQSIALDGFMAGLSSASHTLLPINSAACPSGHCWGTLDETAACDFLSAHTLEIDPSAGTVLADRAGTWGIFEVDQESAPGFSSFEYSFDQVANEIQLDDIANVSRLAFDVEVGGLDRTQLLEVRTSGTTVGGRSVVLSGLISGPSLVQRNGAAAANSCTPSPTAASWCFDGQAGALTLWEPAGSAPAHWIVTP